MRIRWLPEAMEDFDGIAEYLEDRSPAAEAPGTRQLTLRDIRYRVTYRVVDDAVELIEIVHTSGQQLIH
jgi:plasmid stabilization system protein ParE